MAEQSVASSHVHSHRGSALDVIRNIAVIVTLAVTTLGVIIVILLMLSLYPSIRDTVENLESASKSMAEASEEFADMSEEGAQDFAETLENLRVASENYRDRSSR